MTDEIEELVALQRAGGVEVGLLWQGSVDPSLHLNFAVFDGKGAWEPRMNAQGNIVGNIFTINTRDIERIKTTFNTSRISANFTTDQTKEFPIN